MAQVELGRFVRCFAASTLAFVASACSEPEGGGTGPVGGQGVGGGTTGSTAPGGATGIGGATSSTTSNTNGGVAGAGTSTTNGGIAGATTNGGIAGVGASAGESASAGTAGAAGAPNAQDCDGLDGNYKLALAPENTTTFEKSATKFSLTLTSTVDGCKATITPRFYPRSESLAKVSASQVELGAPAADRDAVTSTVTATGWYWGLTFFQEYYWTHLVIPRSIGCAREGTCVAGLGATASAQVAMAWAEDDISSVSLMNYTGTFAVDDEVPAIEAGPAAVSIPVPPPVFMKSTGGKRRPGLPQQLLPWDILEVRASEPLVGLASKLSVKTSAGAPVGVTWSPAESKANVITEGSWHWARFEDWDIISGTTLSVDVAAGLKDIAGHELPAQSLPVEVLNTGAAVTEHVFDDALTIKPLGTITQGEGFITATAPCNSGIGGIAGRLTTAGRSKLMFLVDPDNSLVIKVVGKSGREYAAAATSYAEGFVTWEAAIENESEVGFSLVPNSMCHWTRDTSVKIDRIWAE
jgi:hypothetical protein